MVVSDQKHFFSVLHKPWFVFNKVHEFQKNDFSPRPAVDTVLLRIEKLERPLVENRNAEAFRDFVVFGFFQYESKFKKGLYKCFWSCAILTLGYRPWDLTLRQNQQT
jgi:16S rRNA A1518/A1519 N6-dimethyltransferase RsmA/KsgA/DIM1 with predicted DNA glycosylase/AP lyase activity